jgi:ATP-dependent exoDNAse (exonuclease V) beta subunit
VAAVRGTVVHGLLEDESLWNEALAAERWRAEALGAGLTPTEVEAEWPALLGQLRTMRESADVLAVLDARGASELPVRLDVGALRVEGRIDRLVEDRAGSHGPAGWMVVDYKTEDPGPDPLATALRHRSQLLAYSLAASAVLEANGQGSVRRGGVVFTRTGALVRLPDWSAEDRRSFLDRLAALAAHAGKAASAPTPSPPRAG